MAKIVESFAPVRQRIQAAVEQQPRQVSLAEAMEQVRKFEQAAAIQRRAMKHLPTSDAM
jgi:hypothetical protein